MIPGEQDTHIFAAFRPLDDEERKPSPGMVANMDRKQVFLLTQEDLVRDAVYALRFCVRLPNSPIKIDCVMPARAVAISSGMPRGATLEFLDPLPTENEIEKMEKERLAVLESGGNADGGARDECGKEPPAPFDGIIEVPEEFLKNPAVSHEEKTAIRKPTGQPCFEYENLLGRDLAAFRKILTVARATANIRGTMIDKTMATFSPDVSGFVFPFVSAAIHTFDVMLDVILLKDKIKKKGKPVTEFDLSAFIAYKTEEPQLVVMSFSKQLAFHCMRQTIGNIEKPTAQNLVLSIARVAEFVAASALGAILRKKSTVVEMTRPKIVTGGRVINFPKNRRVVTIKFHSKYGDMCIDMSLPVPYRREFADTPLEG